MLVLASGSVGRRALLANAGVPHDVMPAPIDEDAAKASLRARGLGPGNVAKALAELKALDVSARRPEDLVLGCDQTLALSDGTAHQGVPVWRHVEGVNLTMRVLSDAFIADYLEAEGDVLLGCVGGYRIEGRGVQLFSDIAGSHFAIVGLPLLPLLAFLRTQGVVAT